MMTPDRAKVFGGVDTHKHVHVAAAVDAAGRLLGTAEFLASPEGYGQLAGWAVRRLRRLRRRRLVAAHRRGLQP